MGNVVVVTGASSGIGKAVAEVLLEAEYDIIGVGASERAVLTEQALKERHPNRRIVFFRADLSKMNEVRTLASTVKRQLALWNEPRLYALVNNAGGVVGKYQLTEDGIEYQFALNHLSTLLLANELKAVLMGGMVLFTGSNSHYHARIHWRNLFYKHFYWIFGPYRQSKLANLMTAVELNDRWRNQGIRSYVVDPGLVKTNIGTRTMKGLGKWAWLYVSKRGVAPEVAAKTYLHLIQNRPSEGIYFYLSAPAPYNKVADDRTATKRLFELSCKMLSLDPDL